MPDKDYFDSLSERAKVNGFWDEEYRSTILKQIMDRYKTDVIRNYAITDVVVNGDKFLIKWVKRFMPLTDDELLHDFGRDVKKEK